MRRITAKSVDGRNYGDQEYGYEVNTDNIMLTLKKLGLTTEEWHWRDYRTATKTRRNAPKRYLCECVSVCLLHVGVCIQNAFLSVE